MADITALKAAVDAAITNKNTIHSISPADVGNSITSVIDELLARGMAVAANTGALAALSGTDHLAVFVPGKGVFIYSASGTADGIHVFAGADGFWVQADIVNFNFNTTSVGSIGITNLSADAGALGGLRFYNDTGIHAQLLQGSSMSAYGANVLMLHSIPGIVRLASNNNDIELATMSNQTASAKLRVKNNGQIAIGSDPTPHTSAVLDVQSTTKGFLPPVMTTAQRDAIPTPAAGLIIYNSTTNKLNVFTTAWEAVTSA